MAYSVHTGRGDVERYAFNCFISLPAYILPAQPCQSLRTSRLGWMEAGLAWICRLHVESSFSEKWILISIHLRSLAQMRTGPEATEALLLDGRVPRDRNPFEDEEDENEANEVRRGGSGKGSSIKGTLERMKGVSPLKTLGKLGKSLRMSGRSKGKDAPSPHGSIGSASPMQRKKKGRRSSEGSLLRYDGFHFLLMIP